MTTHPAGNRNVYLFALVDGGGTVPPELAAARGLVERGHAVTVLAEDSMEHEVRATGATFRRWVAAPNRPDRTAENDPYRDWECSNPLQLFSRLLDTQFVGPADRYKIDVDAAIDAARPDLVVCSQFAFGAMVAAEAAGIPFDVLMPNIYLIPARGMTPMGAGLRPAKGPLGRVRDRAVLTVLQRAWDKGLDRLNDLRAQSGLGPLRHFMDQAHRARRHLVMTSAAFDFPGALPANARYVGPVLDDPSWCDQPELVADGPRRTPARPRGAVVHVPGPRDDPAADRGRPRRAARTGRGDDGPRHRAGGDRRARQRRRRPLRSPPRLMPEAALVVTHGGHGTVVKALAAGVPLVVLPHGRDQADNAVRVTERGAGLKLARTAQPSAIAAAVRSAIADPGYRAAAARLGAAIRADAAGTALLAELESVPAPELCRS